ncbi:MAG: hypothetical protein HY812_09445 [Planctomycetes bacterium]|nr:hypothetical protein [Planctomycetota bacterium]
MAVLLVAPSPANAHPHGDPTLWTLRDRLLAFFTSKAGHVALEACEARGARAAAERGAPLPQGALRATLLRWAGRGQVDLAQHVAANAGEAAHDLAACEICSTALHDAALGDPPALAALAPGRGGIIPVTAHAFLAAPRPGRAWQPAAAPRAPAGEDFLRHVAGQEHAVRRGAGLERLDADGDGSAESERADTNGDGSFDCYHVDRDRDGVFEVTFERMESGLWRMVLHDGLLRELRRARAAARAEAKP